MLGELNPGATSKYCPVCERWADAFLPFGRIPRVNAKCPHCGSLERHRLAWLFLQRKSDLLRPRGQKTRLLHIGPEPCLAANFREQPHILYVSADLRGGRQAMVRMDITRIGCRDASMDAVVCSHVLEHVLDDRKAISELYRVLRPHGWALIMVPITVAKTYEDPSLRDPEARTAAFGQPSHVRRYGEDFPERLTSEKFRVNCYDPDRIADRREARKMALLRSDRLYLCARVSA